VYLIDEVHMLSAHSFNALLKTLEEPPPHVKFLLATTDPQKLPVTVLSRCLQFNLKRLPAAEIAAHLRTILAAESVPCDATAVTLIAQAADGSLRDALSLLDQLIAFGGGRAGEAEARAMLGTVAHDHVVRILELLARGDSAELLRCARSLEEFAPDYAQVLDALAGLLVRVGLRQVASGYEGDELYAPEVLERLAAELSPEDVQLFYQTAIIGRRDLPLAPEPGSGFAMTLLRMLAFRPAGAAEGTHTATLAPPEAPRERAAGAASGPGTPGTASTDTSGTARTSATGGVAAGSAATDEGAAWGAIVAQLELSGAARQLATHCVFLGRQGAVIRLGLDPRHQLVRTTTTEEKLAQALARHFGSTVRLEFHSGTAPGAETPAQAQRRASEAELAAARRAFEEDAAVKGLRERFGASVLPDTVRPVK
jgi:DNA polymerase III subunit gamma/tau